MYTLLVCADLYGEKINLELTFPTMPTLAELQRKIVEGFNGEANLRRPQGYPAVEFTIARLQIYDDVMLKWADLVAVTQLHEYDQLYAFQPQSPWHIDVQKDLPPPRPPTQAHRGIPAASPQYESGASVNYSAVNNTPLAAATPQQAYAAPGYTSAPRPAGGGSPQTLSRLEEQRRREQALQSELIRMKEETARLEAVAQQEAEEERRREAENTERLLRQKQEEYQRQRENMLRVEDEIRRLDEEMRLRQQNSSRGAGQQLYR